MGGVWLYAMVLRTTIAFPLGGKLFLNAGEEGGLSIVCLVDWLISKGKTHQYLEEGIKQWGITQTQ